MSSREAAEWAFPNEGGRNTVRRRRKGSLHDDEGRPVNTRKDTCGAIRGNPYLDTHLLGRNVLGELKNWDMVLTAMRMTIPGRD